MIGVPVRGPNREGGRWEGAYLFTLLTASAFFVSAGVCFGLGVQSIATNAVVAGTFTLLSLVAAVLLIRASDGPVAIGTFMVGASLTFGFGTVYGVIGEADAAMRMLFSTETQQNLLAKINLVNATSVLCVVLGAWPLARLNPGARISGGVVRAIQDIEKLRGLLILTSVAILALVLATYPIPENLLLRGFVSTVSKLPLVLVIMVAARWRNEPGISKAAMVGVMTILLGLGVLSASKTGALIPILALLGGLWINRDTRKFALVLAGVATVGYFLLLAPLAGQIRSLQTYDGGAAGLRASVENLNQGARTLREGPQRNTWSLLRRLSVAPYQAYLIRRFDDGAPGSSLSDLWVAAVPRALWPEKPNVTRFGAQLYGEITRTANASSQVGPSYSAEAYWNYGWTGLITISLLVGVQIGWFSKKWLELASGQPRLGILVFAVPVALIGLRPETWIAASFVGGFLTLFFLISAVDHLAARFTAAERAGR